MRRIALLAIVVGFLMPFLASAPAHAQATRTWVSGVGDDVNPCSRTAPCKTFAGAISKTAAGGEINCIDPGGFGAVTITKSIQIICEPGTAGVLVSGTNGIIVNAATPAEVLLQGLDIEGLGTGINGVTIIAATKVTINKSSIRNFTQNGVNVAGPAGARVVIQDSLILSNATGVNVVGTGGAANSAQLIRTTIDNNTVASVNVTAPSAVTMNGSTFLGTAVSVGGTGTVNSFGNNAIGGSVTVTTTTPLK
jgi:hypothetical protein